MIEPPPHRVLSRAGYISPYTVGVSMHMTLQPLMHQLVMQITAAGGADGDEGQGECTQA